MSDENPICPNCLAEHEHLLREATERAIKACAIPIREARAQAFEEAATIATMIGCPHWGTAHDAVRAFKAKAAELRAGK